VRGVYNVHAYEDERRNAMQAWANHIITVISPASRDLHSMQR
jgi:hypothetical protein